MWLQDSRAWAEPPVGAVGTQARALGLRAGTKDTHWGTRDEAPAHDAPGGWGSCQEQSRVVNSLALGAFLKKATPAAEPALNGAECHGCCKAGSMQLSVLARPPAWGHWGHPEGRASARSEGGRERVWTGAQGTEEGKDDVELVSRRWPVGARVGSRRGCDARVGATCARSQSVTYRTSTCSSM